MSSTAEMVMTLSIVPYLYFLYCLKQVHKTNPDLIHPRTVSGFMTLLAFVAFTAVTGVIATKVMGAPTLGHVDFLHGISESGLTITNGIILSGLRKHLKQLEEKENSR
ncbi:DUF3593 domain-containing protein [Heliobacillus mobilis]|uniref:DUF3593 domain-containing protein n=1 Tax=Heliobacterium mobile TaxID=28064 RepID=A0A6I3SP86_HELMO|nr:DUF3593 domain-containing protein [Heliobacterium mobile]MTV50841.1 DUF3593 domain-containing protein [Heliobacterium mobile]